MRGKGGSGYQPVILYRGTRSGNWTRGPTSAWRTRIGRRWSRWPPKRGGRRPDDAAAEPGPAARLSGKPKQKDSENGKALKNRGLRGSKRIYRNFVAVLHEAKIGVRFARGDELRHLVELREVSRLASPRWLDGFGRQRGKIAVSGRRHSHRDLFAAHPEPAQKCF